jgi:hypothetical protein
VIVQLWAAVFDGLAKTAPVSSEAAAALAKNVDMASNVFRSVQNAVLHNGHDHEAGHDVSENSMPSHVKLLIRNLRKTGVEFNSECAVSWKGESRL